MAIVFASWVAWRSFPPTLLLALIKYDTHHGRDCVLLVAPVGNLKELVLSLSYLYYVFVA